MEHLSRVSPELKEILVREIQLILNERFAADEKRQIKFYGDRINFACPYCGDSHNNLKAKRGNLFIDTLYYHCYNGGCVQHKSVITFLNDFKGRLSDNNYYDLLNLIKNNNKELHSNKELKIDSFKILNESGILIEDFIRLYDVIRITPETYRVYPYLKSRLLHKKLENFLYDQKRKLLFVLNLNRDNTRILGYQIRYLLYDIHRNVPKYTIHKNSELRIKAGLSLLDNQDEIDKLSVLFNILKVDLCNTVTVFEGPIDSFFFKNALALTGGGKEPFDLDDIPTVRYMFDSDNAGIKFSINKLKKEKSVFLWNKFLKERRLLNSKIKDFNDLLIYCYKNKVNHLVDIEKYFSNDTRDIIYL